MCTKLASVKDRGEEKRTKKQRAGVCEGEKRERNEGVERFLSPSPMCFHFWNEESKAKQNKPTCVNFIFFQHGSLNFLFWIFMKIFFMTKKYLLMFNISFYLFYSPMAYFE